MILTYPIYSPMRSVVLKASCKPPPQEAPYEQADEDHAAIGQPLVHALPSVDDAQQGVREAQAVEHIQRLPLR